ncbi:MAG TPA: hypothetical protein VG650_02360 [Mycobacteriales bacterium]|nr:hypothetical protein [Mycobacteriales bacterium]
MSAKRALTVLAGAITAGTLGGAVIVGTAASGSTTTPRVPPAAPAPAAPVVPAAPLSVAPKSTLHLGNTLRLTEQTTGARNLSSSHSVLSAALTKPGTTKLVGTAAYSCTGDSSTLEQTCQGAVALRSGVLVIVEKRDFRGQQITGSIVGGTGAYDGAHGTVSGKPLGGGKSRVTLKYSFN